MLLREDGRTSSLGCAPSAIVGTDRVPMRINAPRLIAA